LSRARSLDYALGAVVERVLRDTWGLRSPGTRPLLALLACAGLAAAALWQAPARFRAVDAEADWLAKLAPAERELAGAVGVDLDRELLVEARRLLPPTARYAVVIGPRTPVSHPDTLAAVIPYAAYYLLPRVRVDDPRDADWILAFGAELDPLGLRYRRAIGLFEYVSIAEVRR
jgi:hypothetical protein